MTALGVLSLPAQVNSDADALTDDSETIVLNPFTVDGSGDSGYYATETLSGTNLRTDMRSLANPISVITPEFLSDIGANSYEDVVDFLPSTSTFDGDVADVDGNTARTGTPYNSRGFRVTQLTQNFFATNIRQDNYNTERLTQSRGPNSTLFGLGSVGGAMDITPKRVQFGRNFYNIEARFDDQDSKRFALDINQILHENRFGFRLAALHDDLQGFREPAFRERNSIYGNFTWKPFSRTTVNLWFEDGKIDDLNPRLYLPRDSFTAWRDSALAPIDKANTTDINLIVNGPNGARNSAQNNITGVSRGYNNNNALIWIQNAPELGVMNWKRKSRSSEPYVNGNRQNFASILDPQLLPDTYWALETVPSGPQDQYDTDYYKYGAEILQTITPNTFASFNWVHEKQDVFDFRPIRRQNWRVFIDNNWYLPHQSADDNPDPSTPANPYFGMPYIESNPWRFLRADELDQLRANLTHTFDLSGAEPFDGFDLGELTLVGSWYWMEDKYWLQRQDEMTTVSLFNNGRLDNTQGRIMRRYYINDPTPGYPGDDPIQPLSQAADSSVIGDIRPEVETAFLNRLTPIHTIGETESLSFLGQWGMFKDRVFLTGGWREDKIGSQSATFVRDPVTRIWEDFRTMTVPDQETNKVDNYNWGVVVRPLPWLDLFYNRSTNNVDAGTTTYDIYLNDLPDQTGEGEDMGVRFALLENRLFMKVNYYDNTLQNRISNPLRDSMARETGIIERYLRGMDFNGFDDIIAGSPRYIDYPGNALWSDTEDSNTEGYEFELTANITRDWRLSLNVSKMDATLGSTYNLTTPWFTEFVDPVRGNQDILGRVAFPDEDATETIGDILDEMDRKIAFHRGQVGGQVIRTNTWGANIVTSYNFRNMDAKFLNGIRVGGAYRWREAPAIGYEEDPATGDFLVDQTFSGIEVRNLDLFISKNWNLGNQRRIGVTFRVLNALDYDDFSPRTAVDDGTGNPFELQYSFQEPRTYQLTVDFRF